MRQSYNLRNVTFVVYYTLGIPMAKHLKNLMQGLYYPAVTGTGLVLVLYRGTRHETLPSALADFALIYGILFVVWFSLSFTKISMIPDRNYTLFEFSLDLVEVALTFGMFYYIGLFSMDQILTPRLDGMYGLLVLLTIAQALWRLLQTDRHSKDMWVLRLTLFSTSLIGYFWLHKYLAFNIMAALINSSIAFFYLRVIHQQTQEQE